jgi:5-methylcytosine-specific restriction enzyme A
MPKAPPQHKLPRIGKASQPRRHAEHERDKRRGSARDRGYTHEWDKFSRAFLRSHPLCEFCLGNGTVKQAEHTDHDIPHNGDPELFWANTFTALCAPCHNSTKQRLERTYKGDELRRAIQRAKATGRQGVGQISGG